VWGLRCLLFAGPPQVAMRMRRRSYRKNKPGKQERVTGEIERRKMTVTHPEFNEKATATEVASAFAGQIQGKNGKSLFYLQIDLKKG